MLWIKKLSKKSLSLSKVVLVKPPVFPKEEIKKYSNFVFENKLTLLDWEMFWWHLTYTDYKLAYRYMYYIGLEDKLTNVMLVTKYCSEFLP